MHGFTDRQSVRDFLRAHGLAAKKRFGQHFLVDPTVLDAIIEAAKLGPTDQVLEIGPGLGVLTAALARAVPQGLVLALEKDRDLVTILRDVFKNRTNVKIVAGDVLTTPMNDLIPELPPPYQSLRSGTGFKIVANIPYAVTSPIVTKFLLGDYRGRTAEQSPRPESMTLLVQREVAERLSNEPGHRNRGILTVLIELFGRARIVMTVPREAFEPEPRVESAVLHITLGEPKANPWSFHTLLKAGFANKRRQLHNSLAGSLQLNADTAKRLLEQAGINPLLRAEQLTIDQWLKLHTVVLREVHRAN